MSHEICNFCKQDKEISGFYSVLFIHQKDPKQQPPYKDEDMDIHVTTSKACEECWQKFIERELKTMEIDRLINDAIKKRK
jgi:hypothetical protein